MAGDLIYDVKLGLMDSPFDAKTSYQDLLLPIFKEGNLIYSVPRLIDTKNYCQKQIKLFLARLSPYPISLEKNLQRLKEEIIKNY